MKHMISMVFAALAVGSVSASAATMSCAELKKAYESDKIVETSYVCKRGDTACSVLRNKQLRATVAHYNGAEAASGSILEMKREYDPVYKRVRAGKKKFDTINIDMGDNSFIVYFNTGTGKAAGITVDDGTLMVDGKYCEAVEMDAYINAEKKQNLCEAIVPLVKKKLPKATFDMATCMNETPVDEETGNRTDFNLHGSTTRELEVSVGRNLKDVGGWYLSCSARIGRKSDLVKELDCDIQ